MYKVFLADDEVWVTIGLKKMIEKMEMPFRVVGEASNGFMALEEIEKLQPDILIADIRMPGMDGLELMEQIRKKNKEIKIVLVSGYAEFEYAQTALRLDAFDYLLKPIGYEQLEKVLEKLLTRLEDEGGISEADDERGELPNNMISEIVNDLQERYTENITLASFSEKYNVSIGRLSVLLKEHLGMSYSEYMIMKRIQKAKYLLRNEKMSVEKVGEAVGYSDYCYFTKVFKRVVGLTPSKYRKNI